MTADPIGLAGGLNNYQYVKNPTGWVDPLGLADVPMTCTCSGSKGESSSGEDASPLPDEVEAPNVVTKRLDDDLAGTFAGGRYTSRVLDKDMILYRAGTADRPLGQFFD